jgi:ABC-type oligopeptide transport system substrate-binding subunit
VKRLHTYAATAALMGALTLTACSSSLDHGTITGKKYVPENSYTYMQPVYTQQCTGSGSTRVCTQMLTAMIPIEMTDPECWRLNLRDGKETGHVCVSKETWEAAKVGGTW